MSRYIIDVSRDKSNDASDKPKADINQILENKYGFKSIYLKKFKNDKLDRHLLVGYRIKSKLKKLKLNSDDIVLVHYPIYSGIVFYQYLINYLKKHKVKLVGLVHDVDSLRYDNGPFKKVTDETGFLNNFNYLILHNQSMENKLRINGLKVETCNIGVFDYLTDEDTYKNGIEYKNNITFAGNLNKSKFLKYLQIDSPVHFDLYGNIDDTNNINPTLDYHGSVSPEVLSQKMGRGFGLVWDGDSVDTIKGSLGEYLKYNNPYKLSSYLSAGMPVIIWKNSAISRFVKDNNIGILVDEIDNISSIINNISDDEFRVMCKNVKNIQQRVTSGFYTKKVMDCILNE